MSKTLRLNVNYIILFKIPKNQLSQIYIDQPINVGTLYTLDLFMRNKNNATRKAVKTIILTFRLASFNHYQLGCDDQLIITAKLIMVGRS